MAAGATLRLPAALAAAVLTALIVYASLFPFDGWAWPTGRSFTDLLALPWPRARIPFDLWSNYLGYLPLGLLGVLALWRPGRGIGGPVLASTLLAAALSFALELAQQFLPERHPSLLDWVLNSGGAATGALLAMPLARGGWAVRWVGAVAQWFDTHSAGALLLLLLWPLALLFPSAVPLGLGQVGPRLLPLLADALAGVPWAVEWHDALIAAAAPSAPPTLPTQTAITALGLLAPCLLAFAVVPPGWRRAGFALGASALAIAVLALSTALNFGPQHGLAWVTPAALPGIVAGLLLALLLAPLPRRLAVGLGLMAVTAGVLLVAQLPADPYFAQNLQRWEQGRFIRFHGLSQWIGWGWPFAAGLWLLARLGGGSYNSQMSYYQRHIFFCLNQRDSGEAACEQHGATAAFDHCKRRVKALGLAGQGQVRVNKAGCLDRCAGGPVAVVYPEGTWYTYVDTSDLDEIIDSHLKDGQVVERLVLPPDVGR